MFPFTAAELNKVLKRIDFCSNVEYKNHTIDIFTANSYINLS